MLERLVQLSSITGALLIMGGIIKLIFFYQHFDIDIINYISFSEILTTFLGDINLIVVFIILMSVQSYPATKRLKEIEESEDEDDFQNFINTLYKLRFISIPFIIILILTASLIYFNVISLNLFLIYLLIFFWLQSIFFIIFKKSSKGVIDVSGTFLLLAVSSTLVLTLYLLAQYDIQKTKLNQQETIVTLDNKTIICSKEKKSIYIGKTNNYLFIKTKDNNLIIPTNRLKQITFKHRAETIEK